MAGVPAALHKSIFAFRGIASNSSPKRERGVRCTDGRSTGAITRRLRSGLLFSGVSPVLRPNNISTERCIPNGMRRRSRIVALVAIVAALPYNCPLTTDHSLCGLRVLCAQKSSCPSCFVVKKNKIRTNIPVLSTSIPVSCQSCCFAYQYSCFAYQSCCFSRRNCCFWLPPAQQCVKNRR